MAKISVLSSEVATFSKPVEFEGFNKITISQMKILSGGDLKKLEIRGDIYIDNVSKKVRNFECE